MSNRKIMFSLVVLVAVLSFLASLIGVLTNEPHDVTVFKSLFGEDIELYGKGIYYLNSKAMAAQGIAQDYVTMILGIPLLLVSSYLTLKDSLRGKLLLCGTLTYFLYTYISYSFLWVYNYLFVVYVVIMSASLFALILLMMTFDADKIKMAFNEKTPTKALGIFQMVFAVLIGLMWLGRIAEPMMDPDINAPKGLEHYTTLVIQALDLGFVVPFSFISGLLVLKKKPWGYLLTSIIIIKGITMATAVSAMLIGQMMVGAKVGVEEVVIFSSLNILMLFFLFLLLKNVKTKSQSATNQIS